MIIIQNMLKLTFSKFVILNVHIVDHTFSTQHMEEIKKYGGYPTTDKFNSLEWMKQENKMINSTITRKSICRSILEMVA